MNRFFLSPISVILVILFALPISAVASCITLGWTAPGDDATEGRASFYDIRYSTIFLTDTNWDSAARVPYVPSPALSGSRQVLTVGGLEPGVVYYFAIKTADERLNWSELSNVVERTAPEDVCSGSTGNIDCDPSGSVDISDLTALIDHLFINLRPVCCEREANIDGDPIGSVDITDLTFLIDHLFIKLNPLPGCQ